MKDFNGFPKETLEFLDGLNANNTRLWFNEHKKDYERYVKTPASEFVVAMGETLERIAPTVHAIPKINQSLFRMNRDIRFSKDKRPYKTNLGIWFWEGLGKRMECSGFYFHLEDDRLMLGAGMYIIPKHLMETYRNRVVDDIRGAELRNVVKKLAKAKFGLKGKHYKRTPRGYDASHENAEYLLYNGLHAGIEMRIPDAFFSEELVEFAFAHYEKMNPLHEWLRDSMTMA
ncbi:MAG: DUF2461 domain-containing protein [Proteobacteria bacterium]|nr:DUF2461 domain-containing protein [Pseudomonadota bacterium]